MSMKARIVSRIRAPYGGSYHWRDPLTNVEVMGTTYDMLMDRAYAQRQANGKPIGLAFDDEVEKDVCRDYPNECEGWAPGMVRRHNLGMFEILRGSMVMLKHKVKGSPLVSPEEANRRAGICATCPLNVTFSKPCSGVCQELMHLTEYITGAGSTPYDSDLRSCSLCGCWTKIAVWLPLDIQTSVLSEEQKEQFRSVSHCWKGKGL